MGLIDREMLIKRLQVTPLLSGMTRDGVIDLVETQPEIDNMKHAKNLSPDHPVDGFICSACGFEMAEYIEVVTADEDDPPDKYYCEFIPKFCPNCGARMDQEDLE